jgi:hypothetical protein
MDQISGRSEVIAVNAAYLSTTIAVKRNITENDIKTEEETMKCTKVSALLLAFALVSCATEWGSKMRTSSEVYHALAPDKVEILFSMPTRSCKQIGIVSVMGSTFSSDVAMLKKLRKAAADLGADAVIVASQYQGVVSAPLSSTTFGSANTSGANTTFAATTVGTGGGSSRTPKIRALPSSTRIEEGNSQALATNWNQLALKALQ